MKQLFASIAIVIAMAAPIAAQTVQHDQHTGATLVSSKRVSVKGGLFSNLNAYGIWSSRQGYGVAVEYIGTGGGWHFFKEAWSYGQQLKFSEGNSNVMGCGAGCTLQEGGFIHLSEAQFKKAASEGFGFKLLGSGGSVEGTVPASAFAQVLSAL
jgi:hypothetical protein